MEEALLLNRAPEEGKMAIYTFNILSGYFPTGVDYAQGYRAQLLKDCHQPAKFIFTELPSKKDVALYERPGVHVGQMLSMRSITIAERQG